MSYLFFLIVFLFLIGTLIVTAATGNLAIPLVMGVIFVLTLLVASEVPKASPKNNHHFRNSNKDIQLQENICCPNCGSPVMVRNHRWECGYCGDFGGISSLHPSEKAKLLRASASSVQVTITVTDTSENSKKTDTPLSFSRAELEDMVRRWDFSEDEQACRDLLISAFPAVIGHVTAEDLESMDTQSLLLEISDKDPNIAIDMMVLLLNTVGEKLKYPAVAQQLLGQDMEGTLRDPFVQEPLLQKLKSDDCLAKYLFQSAYIGTLQKDLLEACDWFGEPALRQHLNLLLMQNTYFKDFD